MKIARWQVCIICSYAVLIVFFIISRVFFLKFYLESLFEDRYVEWAQFYFLAFTSGLCFNFARRIWRDQKHIKYFHILFGLLCMFAAMEEISWGQRIFNIESPELFKQYNAQKETELHNIFVGYIDNIISSDYVIGILGILYGILLPIAASLSRRCGALFRGLNIVIPPAILIIGFLSGSVVMILGNYSRHVEIGEFFLYMSLFYCLLIELIDKVTQPSDKNLSKGITKACIAILSLTVLSTAITDWRGQPYGRGVTVYYYANASTFAEYGFYKEAVDQYKKSLQIKSNSQDYSFLENLNKADIIMPPFARSPVIGLVDIGGDKRLSLFSFPSSVISYEVIISEKSLLSFGVALESRSRDRGSGVLLQIYASQDNGSKEVFSKYMDPNSELDRRWNDEVVDLAEYAGRKVKLSFVTTPGFDKNSDFGRAVWSEPRLILNNQLGASH